MDSTPFFRFIQNSLISAAPGNRPDIPIIAIFPPPSPPVFMVSCLLDDSSPWTGSRVSTSTTSRCKCPARAAIVVWLNMATIGISSFNRCFNRVFTVIIFSEFPPTSKKLSLIPGLASPRTSFQTSATNCSISLLGETYSTSERAAEGSGSDNIFLSTFPLVVSGSFSRFTKWAGII